VSGAQRTASVAERAGAVMQMALTDITRALADGAALIREAGEDPAARVRAHVAYSHAQCYAGDLKSALDTLDRVLSLQDQLPSALRAMLLKAMAQPLMRLGRREEAHRFASQAVRAARQAGDDDDIARCLVSLGATERSIGKVTDAAVTLAEAARRAGSNRLVAAAALSNLAECLLDDDRFDEAISTFRQAAGEFDAIGQSHAAAIARGNVADVLGRLGRIDPAIEAFEAARRSFESRGAHLDAARLLGEEAEMLAHAGAHRAARDRCVAALPILEGSEAGLDLSRARLTLGVVLVELGDTDAAQRLLERAREDATDHEILRAEASIALARCAQRRGEDSAALLLLDDAEAVMRTRPARRVRSLLVRAQSLLTLDATVQARVAIEEAAQLARQLHLTAFAPLCQWLGALCDAREGRVQASGEGIVRAAQTATVVLATTASTAARMALVRRYAPIFAARDSTLLDSDWPLAAESILATDVWMNATAGTDAATLHERDGAARAIATDLERLTNEIASIQFDAGTKADARHDTDLASLQARADVLRERLSSSGRLPSITPPTCSDVRSRLGPGCTLLHWFAEGEDLSALTVCESAVNVHRRVTTLSGVRAARSRLAFMAERLADGTDDVPAPAFARVLSHLGRSLLEVLPVNGQVSRSLIISGHELVRTLPWAGIIDSFSAHRAIEELRIAGGVEDALQGPASPPPPRPNVVLIASPDESIPGVAREVEEAAACWSNATVRVGGTAENLLSLASEADILHIATHGVFTPDRPRHSRLRLGDRWVSIDELSRSLKADSVVILSACHAGRSGGLAEDRVALPGVLRSAGARLVVAPIWPVADRTALAVAGALHQRLAVGWSAGTGAAGSLYGAIRTAGVSGLAGADRIGFLAFGGVQC